MQNHSHEKSFFKKSYNLQARIQKRKKLVQFSQGLDYCFVVIQYPGGALFYGQYELFCIKKCLNLHILYKFISSKMKKSKHNFFLMVKGSIRNLSDNIGVLSNDCKEQDGFMYIFVQTESVF